VREAEQALTGRASFAPGLPEVNVFTPRSLAEMIRRAGAHPCATIGLPAVLTPRPDVDLRDEQLLSPQLCDEESFGKILGIEEALLTEGEVPPRGSDLLAIAIVSHAAQCWGDLW
jgi:hypothetical protein